MTEGQRLDRNQLLATGAFLTLFGALGVFVTPWLLLGSLAAALFLPIAWNDFMAHE